MPTSPSREVRGEPLRRETFRKRMERHLLQTEERLEGIVGKRPRLYRHRLPNERPSTRPLPR